MKKTQTCLESYSKHGDYLKDKLEPHPFHPKGRNPYAHICQLIKNNFQESYKDISDEKLNELIVL